MKNGIRNETGLETAKAASAASPSRKEIESPDGVAAFPGHPAPAPKGNPDRKGNLIERADALDEITGRSRKEQRQVQR